MPAIKINISVDDGVERSIELSMGGDWEGWPGPAVRVTKGGTSMISEAWFTSHDDRQTVFEHISDMDTEEAAKDVDAYIDSIAKAAGIDKYLP